MYDNLTLTKSDTTTVEGRSFASFGEVIQGRRTDGEDFLITLPIDLWSVCKLTISEIEGEVLINSNYEKSKKVAELILSMLGITYGYKLDLSFKRNIPVGKGLSSSTADMLAVLRALEKSFDFRLTNIGVSEIFKKIEPHDGIMYDSSVAYNHRAGKLLSCLNYTPAFKILVLDLGGHVDSILYNQALKFTSDLTEKYDLLFQECLNAYERKDDDLIAQCATQSLELYVENNVDELRLAILNRYKDYGAVGVINTHSGTCLGLLFPENKNNESINRIEERIKMDFNLSTFLTKSLSKL